ncbi:MAG: hypothetical protein IJ682_05530 [Lachnospiraceae bacterium]|nr:hypothetical protein [Lachnospiraceae bacterium]
MSKYAGILATGKKHYPSLVFDFSQLNNVSDYFREYRIPSEEKPVVYAYSGQFFSFRLEGSGTLITDEAIYFHPSHHDWARSNRLPLSEICSYVIFQENERDNVCLISGAGERRIFGRTVAPNDTTGAELVDLLKALQKALISGTKEKKDFEKALAYALALIRESFRENGLLDGRYRILLDQIAEYPGFATEVAFIRAEHYYRLCDEGEYHRYLSTLTKDVDESVRRSLQTPDTLFFERYIKHIANASAFYMTKSLIEPYLNLKRLERLTLHQCMLLCFLCIRLEDDDYYRSIFELIRAHLDTDDFWHLSGFAARYYNEKMSGVYEKLLSGATLTAQELAMRDALGLSSLHYALIMRDMPLVRQLLNSFDWSNYHAPRFRDRQIDAVYDFVFAASCLFDDVDLISEIVLHTKPNAKPLGRAIKQLSTSIDIRTRLLEKAMRQDDLESVRDHQEQLEEYRSMKAEVEEELLRLTKNEIAEARKKAETIIAARQPLTKYVLHLYLTPDALYRSIADTISSWRIYRCGDVFFVTSLEHSLELSYFEWKEGKITARYILESELQEADGAASDDSQYFDGMTFINPDRIRQEKKEQEAQQKADEERRRRRRQFHQHVAASQEETPYHGSFFSPQAHKNVRILKQEYRKLVKRYHPDAGGDAHDVEIMLVIMNERADILERMGAG